VQVATRRETTPRKAPEKRGYTELVCGHTVPLANVYISTLGGGLGSIEIWCDRCGEFFHKAPAKRKRKTKKGDNDVPLF
jgi:hypothetical protein